MPDGRKSHWDSVYRDKAPSQLSWHEPNPSQSLMLLRSTGVALDDPILDVGAGASLLVDELLDCGFRDLSVLDVSDEPLRQVRERLGPRGTSLAYLHADVSAFRSLRRYALWHDRAVFHFLIEPAKRRAYVDALRDALQPGGHVVIATFGPTGPQRCSGLPTMRYDASGLAAELGAWLRLLDSRLVVHRTPWGSEQQFLYCLFRSTAVVPDRDAQIIA
jgi:2-polyprenyl-3-methyl-5-hydroxy-6-metoxy-1,4-benzoquinol methylase